MAPFFMLDDFVRYLSTEKRFSEHTCLAYKNDLTQFVEFSDLKTVGDLKEVNPRLIRAWMVDLLTEEYVAASVNRKLSSLRTFFKWLLKEGVIASNPVQSITGPKNQKRLPSFAQSKDLEVVKIEPLFDSDFDGVRDQLVFEMFYQTGIRSSELVNLSDADVQNDKIKVLGKRNKERIIPITLELSTLIEHYRTLRDAVLDKSSFFFVLNNGKKLYPKFVYRKINCYLGRATELEKKSPHVLRHTFATHMLKN